MERLPTLTGFLRYEAPKGQNPRNGLRAEELKVLVIGDSLSQYGAFRSSVSQKLYGPWAHFVAINHHPRLADEASWADRCPGDSFARGSHRHEPISDLVPRELGVTNAPKGFSLSTKYPLARNPFVP